MAACLVSGCLVLLSVPMLLNMSTIDTIRWLEGPQSIVDFSVSSVWQTLDPHLTTADWPNSVWFKGCVPKHSLCLWVACHNRLPTRDRIALWNHDPPDMLCTFCKNVSDSHEHLFFQCQFSLEVWRAVKHQLQLYGYHERWPDIMDSLKNQRGPKKTEHCLALAASI